MRKRLSIYSFLILSLALLSNGETNHLDVTPDHFPTPVYDFEANPLNPRIIELGRALFYDPILSKDGTISCSSCHSPYNGFAHTDHKLSHGIDDKIGDRNAPALFNLAWQSRFMWDGAVHHLDAQALSPLTSEIEMGENIENVLNKLQTSQIYKNLFIEAFGDTSMTSVRLLKSLAQFQLTLVSATSKYDDVVRGVDSFTIKENNGYQVFKKNCASCHVEPLFSNGKFEKNGLGIDSSLHDMGRYKVTLDTVDAYRFKVPSLRNLSYTYPYMHDGRFSHLRDVIEHYSGKRLFKDGKVIHMTENERTELVAFLICLDDKKFIFNKKNKFPRHLLMPSFE